MGVHTSHNTGGNIRSLVANDKTEFKILTVGLLANSEIMRQPIKKHGSKKKIRVLERN
jgi:hypothetical protein